MAIHGLVTPFSLTLQLNYCIYTALVRFLVGLFAVVHEFILIFLCVSSPLTTGYKKETANDIFDTCLSVCGSLILKAKCAFVLPPCGTRIN